MTAVTRQRQGAANASAQPRIQLLGEVALWHGGQRQPLPRSRKCRALLAYLAATQKPQRRQHLCDLLFTWPADPRAALRWTLSKLRPLLGDALVTDGETVVLEPDSVSVDTVELRGAAHHAASLDTAELERIAAWCGPAFCEALDLIRCPDFESWIVAAREDVRQAQLDLLDALLERVRGDPERGLPVARTLLDLDPLAEQRWTDLLCLLEAGGRIAEADRQRQIAASMLAEAGVPIPPALGARAKAPARPVAAPPAAATQFCTAPDGTRIAYSVTGDGPPLVKTANWMSHLEFERQSPLARHWLAEFSRSQTLIRYDARGSGLSDRNPPDLSLDAFVTDLDAVVGATVEGTFDLLGVSQGCPIAIAYAVRHPERVRKLVLFGGFAAGWRHSESANARGRWEAMITLAAFGWGQDNPAFRQMFTSLFLPDATNEEARWLNDLQRASATPDQAQRLLSAIGEFDVRASLAAVRVPSLVLHCRDDAIVPLSAGHHLATSLPGAQFVSLDSRNHVPLEHEPAWRALVDQVRAFLA